MMHRNGPAARGGLSGLKGSGATVKRLLRYVTQGYRWPFIGVLLCILISAAAGVAGSLFLQVLIDDYITPLLVQANPDFSGLLRAVMVMGCIYLAGVAATYLYNLSLIHIFLLKKAPHRLVIMVRIYPKRRDPFSEAALFRLLQHPGSHPRALKALSLIHI